MNKIKNCLIVGASGGIGTEITKKISELNYNLFLVGQNKKKLVKLKEEILEKNAVIKIEIETVDLTNDQSIKNVIKKIRKKFGIIDILINTAGVFMIKSLANSSIEEFDDSFKINVRSPFIFCKEFSKDMKKNKWGRIINIGSSSSYAGFKNGTVYCTSKHGILGLSRALQNELKQYNVRVFCISPASTQTEMAKISSDQDFSTFLNPNEVAKFIIYSISFDSEMIVDEVKLNRMIMK